MSYFQRPFKTKFDAFFLFVMLYLIPRLFLRYFSFKILQKWQDCCKKLRKLNKKRLLFWPAQICCFFSLRQLQDWIATKIQSWKEDFHTFAFKKFYILTASFYFFFSFFFWKCSNDFLLLSATLINYQLSYAYLIIQ